MADLADIEAALASPQDQEAIQRAAGAVPGAEGPTPGIAANVIGPALRGAFEYFVKPAVGTAEEAGLRPRVLTRQASDDEWETAIAGRLVEAGLPPDQARLEAVLQRDRQKAAGVQAPRPYEHPVAETGRAFTRLARRPREELPRAGGQFVEGMMNGLARVTGLPVEALNLPLWLAGSRYAAKPGDAIGAVQDAFREFGIPMPDQDFQTFMNKWGAGSVDALLTFGVMKGLGAGLPARPAGVPTGRVPGEGIGRTIRRTLGEGAQQRPVSTLGGLEAATPGSIYVGERGSEIGGAIGETVGGRTGRVVGEIAGGIGGGLVGGAMTAPPAVRVAQRLGGERPPSIIPTGSAPIADALANPGAVTNYVQGQVEAATVRLNDEIETALRTVQARGNRSAPAQSRILMRAVDRVAEAGRAIEDEAWAAVDRTTGIGPSLLFPVRALINQIGNNRNLSAIPRGVIRNIEDLVEQYTVPAGGAVARLPIPVGRLLEVRSDILQAMREAQAGTANTAPNLALYRNLNMIQGRLLAAIEAGTPGNPAIENALAISRTVNDRLSRSPIAQIMAATQRGEGRIAPEVAGSELMRDTRQFGTGGPQSVIDATQPIPRAPAPTYGPTGFPTNASAQLQTAGPHAINAMDDYIRADFRQAVDEAVAAKVPTSADPVANQSARTETAVRAADRWRSQFEEQAAPFVRATTRIANAMARMNTSFANRIAVENAALTRFFVARGLNTTSAVEQIMRSENPARTIREVLGGTAGLPGIARDPAALAGFRRTLVTEFLRESGGTDVARVAARFRTPRWASAFNAVLDPAEMARMTRIMNTAEQLASQDPRVVRRVMGRGLTFLGNLVGLHGGHIVAKVLAGNTQQGALSFPARGAAIGRNWVANFMRERPVQEMMQMAIFDERVERMLLSRLPSNRSELTRFARLADQAARRITTARETTVRELTRDREEERRQRLERIK